MRTEIQSHEEYQVSIRAPSRKQSYLERSLEFTLKERFPRLAGKSFIVANTQIGGQQLLMKARLASILNCHTRRDARARLQKETFTFVRAIDVLLSSPRKSKQRHYCSSVQANVFAFAYASHIRPLPLASCLLKRSVRLSRFTYPAHTVVF